MAKLAPYYVCNIRFNKLQDSIDMYIDKLNGLDLLADTKAEFDRWQSKWLKVIESERPSTTLAYSKNCSKLQFPNIYLLLRVPVTIPVSTATAKQRAFLRLKLIKTYSRLSWVKTV